MEMVRGTDGGQGAGDRALYQMQMRAVRGQMGSQKFRCGIGNVGRVQQSRVIKTGGADPKERTAANMHTTTAADEACIAKKERGEREGVWQMPKQLKLIIRFFFNHFKWISRF